VLRLATVLLATLANCGCTLLFPDVNQDVRCLDLPASTCEEAWSLVEDRLLTRDDAHVVDVVIGRSGGAAEGCGDKCGEQVYVTVSYDTGDEMFALLTQMDDGLVLGPVEIRSR
jgi:hypothetical protein